MLLITTAGKLKAEIEQMFGVNFLLVFLLLVEIIKSNNSLRFKVVTCILKLVAYSGYAPMYGNCHLLSPWHR